MLKIKVIVDKHKLITAVYDNGSTCSLVNENLVRLLKSKLYANKAVLKSLGGVDFCRNRAKLHLKIGGIEDTLNVCVVKNNNFNYDLLLGLDAIRKFKLIQDENLEIKQKISNKYVEVNDLKNLSEAIPREMYLNEELSENSCLDGDVQIKIKEICEEFKDCFAENKYDVGLRVVTEATIKLKEDRYISKKPYRCSFPDQSEIDLQISKLLENDLIEESYSPFASPVTLAFKKQDGRRTRLCIDFRELNKIVVPEPQPFPRIDDLVVDVGDCQWFTALDINSAFWSIPMREKDRFKTAFITQKGHWQWKVLPFGFKNSPAIFQRILSNILRKHKLSNFCVNYIDDILIFSKNLEEHLLHIKLVMEALKLNGFKLNFKKCSFATHSVKYLGHVIENGKICPINDNLIAIKNFRRPTTRKMVRQILGKINFYHKFIDHCNQRLAPLHHLLKKNEKFVWTDRCEAAFDAIKDYLCSSPILAIYDREKETVLEVDASRSGLGAVLKQIQCDGVLHPVGYFSKKLTPSQTKKEIMYLECLAIKEAILYWQHYLIGRSFVVISDHKPLINLKTKSRTDEALGDLMLYLSQYDFKIIYREGKSNIEADALSRNPVLEDFENKKDCLKYINMVQIDEIINDQRANRVEIEKSKNIYKDGAITYKKLNNRKRIYISEKFGLYLVKKIHRFYGHIGTYQIAEKLRSFYYFKNMDKTISEFCKSCAVCVQNKSRSGRAIGLLSKLGPAEYPFHIMSMDTIGGFGGNRSQHKYLHLLVDHFSRYAWIQTSKGQDSGDFIKLLDPLTKENNIKILLVDQYGAFNAQNFKKYLNDKKIQLLYTSVDHPQSNGLNERLNQTLVNRIRCRINEDNENLSWTRVAKSCVQEYNNTFHSTTKFSPSYLLFGKKSEIIPEVLQPNSDLIKDRLQAFKNSCISFEKNKQRLDRSRKEFEFKIGDLVFISNGNKLNRNKLDQVRRGPFRILKRISSSIYEVDDDKKRRGAKFFHSNKLVPCFYSS